MIVFPPVTVLGVNDLTMVPSASSSDDDSRIVFSFDLVDEVLTAAAERPRSARAERADRAAADALVDHDVTGLEVVVVRERQRRLADVHHTCCVELDAELERRARGRRAAAVDDDAVGAPVAEPADRVRVRDRAVLDVRIGRGRRAVDDGVAGLDAVRKREGQRVRAGVDVRDRPVGELGRCAAVHRGDRQRARRSPGRSHPRRWRSTCGRACACASLPAWMLTTPPLDAFAKASASVLAFARTRTFWVAVTLPRAELRGDVRSR